MVIAAKPTVVANTNEELGGPDTAIPPIAKLLWFWFTVDFYNNSKSVC